MHRIPKVISALRQFSTHSRPFLVKADDDQLYVLKHAETKKHIIAGELFATRVGILMKVPVLNCTVIEVEAQWLDIFQPFPDPKPSVGFYFATKYLADSQPVRSVPRHDRHLILNHSDVGISVTYDTLIANGDRHEDNALIKIESNGYRVFLIDQGHAYGGPSWSALANPLDIQPQWRAADEIFGVDRSTVIKQLTTCNATVGGISESDLESIIKSIPKTWWDKSDPKILIDFVMKRKGQVCSILGQV